jgi:hypothetical protein
MTKIILTTISFLILAVSSLGAQASLVITIDGNAYTNYSIDGGSTTACDGPWITGDTSTPTDECTYSSETGMNDDDVFPFLDDLTLAYKDDGSEEGSLASSYSTDLVSGTSNDTDITYVSGDFVDCSADCWLVAKDGGADPNRYLFNLAALGWDGMETIELNDFFADNSISHMAIWGNISEVPVPAAMWLFGTALIGFIGVSRRTKV